ncbi:MAG: DUF3568 family protein [Gemmatimonadales bacterium]
MTRNRTARRARAWLLLTIAPLAGGCVLGAAAAGAGGAVYVSERGAEAVVDASVDKTFEAARQTFREMNIDESRTTSEENGGVTRKELSGTTAEREIEVEMETQGAGTKVEVVASKSRVTWDKDMAKRILERIVQLSK